MHCGSKVKSEYMKRYKDPKWDTCGPCYRELLHYRLSRRLLEQTHNPWLWDGWGPSSNSDDSSSSGGGGASTPLGPQGASAPSPPPTPLKPEREGEELGVEEKGAEASEDEDVASPPETPEKDTQEKNKQQMEVKKQQIEVKDKLMDNTDHPRQRALLSGTEKKTAKSPQRPSKTKEVKHPFALYGWGEKQTDTGSQKTHNVCASASEKQIHESALRAKNRRQVEKRKLVNQRQRAYSVDVQKPRRSKPSSSDSPWMTEYMRCYSARA
ncbi:centriole, cilia and spindle-associated protein [Gracilinanus agilis]|uniref:centriole, cilia and spindle-associated protein n=1 Tax=Gracilinanus agilis TaxID=191870 RepID=UPI001CFC49C5|nr:centriole, cilia and spindle-associated protein [Gracilinanus agilis]